MEVLEDSQVTDWVELVGFTVAVMVAVSSVSMDSVELLRVIDVVLTSEVETMTVHVPLTNPEVAVIVAVPAATAVTTPELETVATKVLEDFQVTLWSAVEGRTVAVSVVVPPTARATEEVSTVTEVAVGVVTVTLHVAE
jgi:hypothetical protein